MNVISVLMTLLDVDANTAEHMRQEMVSNGVDFDRISVREFNRCARECHDTLMAVQADMAVSA
jgi:hypothetical protein